MRNGSRWLYRLAGVAAVVVVTVVLFLISDATMSSADKERQSTESGADPWGWIWIALYPALGGYAGDLIWQVRALRRRLEAAGRNEHDGRARSSPA
jgi:hypothetical protein